MRATERCSHITKEEVNLERLGGPLGGFETTLNSLDRPKAGELGKFQDKNGRVQDEHNRDVRQVSIRFQ